MYKNGNYIRNKNEWAKNKGYTNYQEYRNEMAKKRGFKDWNDYVNERNHETNRYLPMNKSKNCSLYLGVYIAENVLSKVFKNVKRLPINNKGYDFVCDKGYKIDVKSSCLSHNFWRFGVHKNRIADYFLLLAFDNRNNLNPIHLWLIGGAEPVGINNEVPLNNKSSLSIRDDNESLWIYEPYEVSDKLSNVIECCDVFKNKKFL